MSDCDSLESGEMVNAYSQSVILPFFPSALPHSVCLNIQNDNDRSEYILRIVAENPSKTNVLSRLFSSSEQEQQSDNDCKLSINGVSKDSLFTYKSSTDELVFVVKTIPDTHTFSVHCSETNNTVGIISVAKFDDVLFYQDQDKPLDIKPGKPMNVLFAAMASNIEFPAVNLEIISDPFNVLQNDLELAEDNVEPKIVEDVIPNISERATSRRLMTDARLEDNKMEETVTQIQEIINDINGESASFEETPDFQSLFADFAKETMIQDIHIEARPKLPVSLQGNVPLSDFNAIAYPLDIFAPKISFLDDDSFQIQASIDSDYAFIFENDGLDAIKITLKSSSVNTDFVDDIENSLHGILPIPDAEVDKMIQTAFDKQNDKMPVSASIQSYQIEHGNDSESGFFSLFTTLLPIVFLVLLIVAVTSALVFIKRQIVGLLNESRSESEEEQQQTFEQVATAYYQMEDDYNTYSQINENQLAL